MSDRNFNSQESGKTQVGQTVQKRLPDGRVIKFVIGDLSGDGKIGPEDIEMLRMLAEGGPTVDKILSQLTPEQIAACDITGDGAINRNDLLELCKSILNKPVDPTEDKLSKLRNKLKQ